MMELFFYLLLAMGILILYLPEMRDLQRLLLFYAGTWLSGFRSDENWYKLKRERFRVNLLEHIRILLQAAISMGTRKGVKAFGILSVSCGITVCFFTAGRVSWLLMLGSAGIGSLLPYLLLRCAVQGKQVSGSQEGEILVTELLSNYKIHYCNMVRAVEETALTIEGAPYCRKLLFNLSRGLNKASGESELKLLLHEFQYSLGTSWASVLSTNIYLACSSGIKVSASLQDLAYSMEHARDVEEFLHRENNEVRMILRYLVPGSSLILTVGGIYFFGLSPGEWFRYQFCTGAGIAWLLLFVLLYLTAAVVYLGLSARKFDL